MTGMPSRIGYARPAARETSSCRCRSYSSGPLVTGHTRMSSSLGSMLNTVQSRFDHIRECAIQADVQRHDPQAFVMRQRLIVPAFYGVFFGDQDPVDSVTG